MSDIPSHNESLFTGRRPTWAEIDLDALASNFQVVKNRVGPDVKVMAVVKANAYGHGAVECARRLESEGADWFGVALPEEGIELRRGGITKPILCLGGFWEGQPGACIQHSLVPVVYRIDAVEALDRASASAGKIADFHLKLDTGMGRLGVRYDQIGEFIPQLKRFKNVRLDGVMTHFAAADDPSCQPLTGNQSQRFEGVLAHLSNEGFNPSFRHLANSAGIYGDSKGWGNMVRPGGVLYGMWRDVLPPNIQQTGFKPVMSLRSRITLLKWVPPGETIGYGCTFEASRKSLIATVPLGYDDGYMRGLSNRAHVVIRGSFAPVVGRISMDLTIIDVTNVPDVALNDEVTLFGVAGEQKIPVEDLARIVGTLSYEVTCGIGQRVPRIYLK